ncbi:ATP-binding protein [uncultured Sphaerochaeta sp.]|uniref:ATP-binding protein n=1 Tax=uncultured Sphaerochaeta sp. TaxID=886478 RepID=UPI0029CA96A4|nr:ATP-binding protein [uncultured Sphaerochaeta sp.]
MQYKSIRARLALTTFLVLVCSLFGSMWIANRSFATTIRETTYAELSAKAEYLATLSKNSSEPWMTEHFDSYAASTATRITIINREGAVLFDSDYAAETLNNHLYREEVQAALKNGSASSERRSSTQNLPVLYWAVALEDHPTIAILRVSKTLNQLSGYQRTYQSLFFRGLGVLVLFFLLLTFFVITMITRPLDRLKGLARKYATGDLQARIHLSSPQELAELAHTMEEMAQEIQEKISQVEFGKNQVEAILNSLSEGILLLDRNLNIKVANREAHLLFTDQRDSVLDKNLSQLISSNEVRTLCNATLRDGEERELTIEQYGHLFGHTARIAGKQQVRELRMLTCAVRSSEGFINSVVLSINDMTELKRLEQIRKDFVANVSHELKTPITSIAGFAEALTETQNPEEITHFSKIISRQANRMRQLVEDLLLLSSLEQEQHKASMSWTTLEQIIGETEEACSYRYEERGSSLHIASDNPDNLLLYVNENLIAQALTNLVINALNYSEAGSKVHLSATVREDQIVFSVKDHGIGIPKDVQDRIFERFYRVDAARSRSQGGTGLGLSIVKHIVNVHGGKLSLESELRKGSTFIITLPRMGGNLKDLQKRSEELYQRR